MAAPTLPAELTEQLQRVPTSDDRGFRYAPCQVVLTSGEVLPRVYVSEESAYLHRWGEDSGRAMIALADVASIIESPQRLPARLADEIYAAGESGMGYAIFTVLLRDGRSIPFLTGDAVDFPDWPDDVDPRDAVAVEPHAGREFFVEPGHGRRDAPYSWCLYRA